MGPMRIAFVADDVYPGYGGQARATEGHVRALVDLGHEVRVLAGREAAPTEPPPGVAIERLPVFRPGDLQTHFAAPWYPAAARLTRWADVVQVNVPAPLGALVCVLARRRGTPCVFGFHTQLESSTMHFRHGAGIVGQALETWYRHLYRLPDALTTPTAFAARLARAWTRRPVVVVSNGITLPTTTDNDRDEARALRRALGGRRLLAYVGRLSPEKSPASLVELVAGLASDVVLAIAGDGPCLNDVRARCAAAGVEDRVHLLGFVDERRKHLLLLAADAFVMPSPTELQSIATLEAMARGCAVIAADHVTSAVPDLVRDADCGLVYPPARPSEAAAELGALLRDERRLTTLQAHARAGAARHDVRRSGVALAELYTLLRAVTPPR